jgi:hypothetical protein
LWKTFGNLNLTGTYAHQRAKSIADSQSSTAGSSFGNMFTTGDIFQQVLSTSAFQVEHRITASAAYNFVTGPLSHGLGLFWVAQSGQPYSLTMAGDPNRDGNSNNDLMYVPSSYILCPSGATGTPAAGAPCRTSGSNPTTLTPLDPSKLSTFLSSVGLDGHTGFVQRNAVDQPWTRRLDLHYELGLPQIIGTRIQIEADILNLLNLFDRKYGQQRFVFNQVYQTIAYVGQDANGTPILREAANNRLTPGTQYSLGNVASRWQGRLGLRINF